MQVTFQPSCYDYTYCVAAKLTEEATKQAHKVGQTISQKGEEISKTQTYRTISDTAKAVKEEIDQSTFGGAGARVYKAPKKLRKRVERDPDAEKRIIQVLIGRSCDLFIFLVFVLIVFL